MKDFYAILEVATTATAVEITAAFKKKIKLVHPDINKAADAATKTQELNEAYATLNNPQKKQQYDFQRSAPNRPRGFQFDFNMGANGMPRMMHIIVVRTPQGEQVFINNVRVK